MKTSKAGDPPAVPEPVEITELKQFEYVKDLKTSNLNRYHVRPKCAKENKQTKPPVQLIPDSAFHILLFQRA